MSMLPPLLLAGVILSSSHETSDQDIKIEQNSPCRWKKQSKPAQWFGKVFFIIYVCIVCFYCKLSIVMLLKWLLKVPLSVYVSGLLIHNFRLRHSYYACFNENTFINNKSRKEITGSWTVVFLTFHMKVRNEYGQSLEKTQMTPWSLDRNSDKKVWVGIQDAYKLEEKFCQRTL